MKFHEDHAVQEIKRVEVVCCDRCGKKAPIDYSDVSEWFEARTWLLAAYDADMTYHLCPGCRMALGAFMEGTGEADKSLIERLADILYPMDGFADEPWNGGDVCEALADVLRDVAPWAEHRQPQEPGDAFAAYKAERERLGI